MPEQDNHKKTENLPEEDYDEIDAFLESDLEADDPKLYDGIKDITNPELFITDVTNEHPDELRLDADSTDRSLYGSTVGLSSAVENDSATLSPEGTTSQISDLISTQEDATYSQEVLSSSDSDVSASDVLPLPEFINSEQENSDIQQSGNINNYQRSDDAAFADNLEVDIPQQEPALIVDVELPAEVDNSEQILSEAISSEDITNDGVINTNAEYLNKNISGESQVINNSQEYLSSESVEDKKIEEVGYQTEINEEVMPDDSEGLENNRDNVDLVDSSNTQELVDNSDVEEEVNAEYFDNETDSDQEIGVEDSLNPDEGEEVVISDSSSDIENPNTTNDLEEDIQAEYSNNESDLDQIISADDSANIEDVLEDIDSDISIDSEDSGFTNDFEGEVQTEDSDQVTVPDDLVNTEGSDEGIDTASFDASDEFDTINSSNEEEQAGEFGDESDLDQVIVSDDLVNTEFSSDEVGNTNSDETEELALHEEDDVSDNTSNVVTNNSSTYEESEVEQGFDSGDSDFNGDNNRNHGNDEDSIDDDNPGKGGASVEAESDEFDSDGDNNRGHGNDEDGVDDDNPGKGGANFEAESDEFDSDDNNDRGHGNDEDGVDDDNPGKGGANFEAESDEFDSDDNYDRGHGNNEDGVDDDNPGKGGANFDVESDEFDSDGDNNRGHGNDEDGVDDDNPGKGGANLDAESEEFDSDGDNNRGHGNDEDGVDDDNPGKGGGRFDNDFDEQEDLFEETNFSEDEIEIDDLLELSESEVSPYAADSGSWSDDVSEFAAEDRFNSFEGGDWSSDTNDDLGDLSDISDNDSFEESEMESNSDDLEVGVDEIEADSENLI